MLGQRMMLNSSTEVSCPSHSGNISRPLQSSKHTTLRVIRFFMLSGNFLTIGQSLIEMCSREARCPNHSGSASNCFNDVKNSVVREVKHRTTSGNALKPLHDST